MKSYIIGERRRRWKLAGIFLIIITLLVFGTLTYGIRRIYNENLLPISTSEKSKLIIIPSGATVQEISKILEDEGIIKASWAFEWYVRNNNLRDKLQAGTYALRPSQSVQEILTIITKGKIATDLVTVFPGQRIENVRDSLINQGFDANQVDEALIANMYINHPALVDKPTNANLEGYIFPESFQRTATTEVKTIITLALNELQKHLTPDVRAGIVKQGLTVHEAIIMASIVGQEVSNPDEQKIVSQIFIKRLREGIPLGADATTRYAINKPINPLTIEDLGNDSPYNTRKFKGLPPGPISNFKASALEAVAFPSNTDYLFFVTGRDFITRFSKTATEHQALIDKYGVGGEEY